MINLRTLRPLDYGTVIRSVTKTNRLVTVEEGWPQNGIGADISAVVTEEAFDHLDAPIERVSSIFSILCFFPSFFFSLFSEFFIMLKYSFSRPN